MQCNERVRAVLQVLVGLSVMIGFSGTAASQDVETVKATMLKSLAKIEGYSAGVVEGRWVALGAIERAGVFHFRGEKMWIELEGRNLDEPAEQHAARVRASREIMGTEGMLHTSQFDGKKFYDFDPYNLALRVQSTTKRPAIFSGLPLSPKNWLYMGGAPTQLFSRFIGDADYEVKVEDLGGGRWKLSQSDLGSRLPEEIRSQFIGVKDRHVIVDEKFDFLITEYYGKGAKVEVAGFLEWENQEGNWYVKHGKQLLGGRPHSEWFIDAITFDASKCRSQFDDLEPEVPGATRIDIYDERGRRVSHTYKDGEKGEVEHRLRRLAWLERQKEGF